jgi:hypothetical protein
MSDREGYLRNVEALRANDELQARVQELERGIKTHLEAEEQITSMPYLDQTKGWRDLALLDLAKLWEKRDE